MSIQIRKRRLDILFPRAYSSLFVQVAYLGDMCHLKNVKFNNQTIDLTKFISLVSIENAIHQSEGWHVNNFHKFKKNKIPLKDLTKDIYGFKKR